METRRPGRRGLALSVMGFGAPAGEEPGARA
jgi:hypothetical protein